LAYVESMKLQDRCRKLGEAIVGKSNGENSTNTMHTHSYIHTFIHTYTHTIVDEKTRREEATDSADWGHHEHKRQKEQREAVLELTLREARSSWPKACHFTDALRKYCCVRRGV
jgi:hypothetical protein